MTTPRRREARKRGAGLLLCYALVVPGANGQEPGQRTLDSAHRFVTERLGNGISGFELADEAGRPDGTEAIITRVTSHGCNTHLVGSANGETRSRSIDWSRISEIQMGGGGHFINDMPRNSIRLAGPIAAGDGMLPETYLLLESFPMSERIKAALDFIHATCSASSTGF